MRTTSVLDRERMVEVLGRVVTTLYGNNPVPAVDGGWLFRAICEERRRNDDFFWTERRVHDLARELGYWPWSVMQVHSAIRTGVDAVPVMDASRAANADQVEAPSTEVAP